jgi:ABC-2 type transport system ATP-binding protein
VEGVSVRGLTKRFGDVLALHDAHFDVRGGEVVALLGPNGAGKSTLLRILATTLLPDEGSASVGGEDVVAAPAAARRQLGFLLTDERSWYWRVSGRANLEFFAALHGMRREAAAHRTAELLEEFGLGDAADRRFGTYSSGMKLRLSLARALLVRPSALLLDEPTRSLDPIATRDFRELISIQAHSGTAVLFATHDLHEAAAVAPRVLIMVGGRLATVPEDCTSAAELERALLAAA